MMKMSATSRGEKPVFVDLRFFLGLIFLIYGSILIFTGVYYSLNFRLETDPRIDIYWGVLMFAVGVVNYYVSDKPKNWNKAFAIADIEKIERRLKSI